MGSKYFYMDTELDPDYHKLAVDACTHLEELATRFKKAGNKQSAFAYEDSVRIIRKLENIYMEREKEKSWVEV